MYLNRGQVIQWECKKHKNYFGTPGKIPYQQGYQTVRYEYRSQRSGHHITPLFDFSITNILIPGVAFMNGTHVV